MRGSTEGGKRALSSLQVFARAQQMRLREFPVRSSRPNFSLVFRKLRLQQPIQSRPALFRIFFPSSPSLILIASPWHLPCFPTPSRALASTWPARYNTFSFPWEQLESPFHISVTCTTPPNNLRSCRGTTEINTNTTHSGDPAPTLHGTVAGITSTLLQTSANTFHNVLIASGAISNCDATHGSSLRSLLIFGSTAFRNTKQIHYSEKKRILVNQLGSRLFCWTIVDQDHHTLFPASRSYFHSFLRAYLAFTRNITRYSPWY